MIQNGTYDQAFRMEKTHTPAALPPTKHGTQYALMFNVGNTNQKYLKVSDISHNFSLFRTTHSNFGPTFAHAQSLVQSCITICPIEYSSYIMSVALYSSYNATLIHTYYTMTSSASLLYKMCYK